MDVPRAGTFAYRLARMAEAVWFVSARQRSVGLSKTGVPFSVRRLS